MASVGADTSAKSVADAIGLLSGLAAGVITARWLGPEGKGVFSSLTLIAGLAMQSAVLGLGDAMVVLTNRRETRLDIAFSSTLITAGLSSIVAAAIVCGVSIWQFPEMWDAERAVIILVSLSVPITVGSQVAQHALITDRRLVRSSLAVAVSSFGTASAIGLYVIVLEGGLAGAVLGSLTGTFAGAAVAAIALRRTGAWGGWRVSTDYVRRALRFGVVVQVAYLTMAAAARLDLLVVLNIAGEAAAGRYSVALTVGGLAVTLPAALAYAVYPRMAATSEADTPSFLSRVARTAVASALLAAGALAVVTPVAVPFLFGAAFAESVVPTLLLMLVAPLWAAKWVLARMAAAQERPRVLLLSFGANLAVMVGLDFALVPLLGLPGAALAAVAGSLIGSVVAYVLCRRWLWDGLTLRHLVPTLADFRRVLNAPLDLVRRLGRRLARSDDLEEG